MAPLNICFHSLIAETDACVSNDIMIDNEQFADLCELRIKEIIDSCIKTLPRQQSDSGLLGVLDRINDRKFKLPRIMPCPEPKIATSKWAKFAASKGIVKDKHRNRMVYDKQDDAYKLRYGGRSIKKSEEKREFLIEHKSEKDAYTDPFEQKATEKALRKTSQKMREIKNKVRAAGYRLAHKSNKKSKS